MAIGIECYEMILNHINDLVRNLTEQKRGGLFNSSLYGKRKRECFIRVDA